MVADKEITDQKGLEMTKFERTVNAYDYLKERILSTDEIVDIYEIDTEPHMYRAIIISKYHNVIEYIFNTNDFLKCKVLD